MIYAENLKVYCEYDINGILDMEFTVAEGQHGKLVLRGRLADRTAMPVKGGTIRVTGGNGGDSSEETLFQGNILESHIFVENGVSQIILSAETGDEEMDRKKRSRSFQDVTLTYDRIIRDILSEYGGTLQCGMPAVKIGKPVIQYEETDWEFCRRLAGSMGAGIFSHEDSTHPYLAAGLSEGRMVEIPPDEYRCGVDENYYRRGREQGAEKAEFLYYEVSDGQHYRIGDHARYKGRKLYIYEVKAVLEKEELVFTYRLGGACRFRGTARPNRKLAGLAVPGRVERTEGESVYLKLDMDGGKGKAAYPFAWVPATGNPAYCMPQAGTRAYLYFPDCHGQETLAVGSIRTNGAASCFGNVQERGLETEHGKLLGLGADTLCFAGGRPMGIQQAVLGPDSLLMQAGEGNFFLRAGKGILVQAPCVTVRTPLAINQNRTGQNGTGRKNPSTGGRTYLSSQYEFSITSSLGELVGTEYEEYNPFENEISYESYEAVEKRRRDGLLKGIITALAIGAAVAVVALTGGAALGVALAVGAVVAGVGSIASAVTYMRDRENSTASQAETYINNAETASLITASVIAMFWIAPYAAGAVAGEVSQGLPLTVLFGQVFTLEELTEWALIGTQGAALLNAFFQANELSAFFGGTKELGAPTGCAGYDEMKQLTEAWCMQLFLMGFTYWLQEKAAAKALADTGGKQGQGTQAKDGRKSNFDNEIPRSGKEWHEFLKEKYNKSDVYWNINSIDDIFSDPTRLKGYTVDELQQILGGDWIRGVYGSNGGGWKLMKGDISIFYHPGGGIHGGSYYGISSGAAGKIKVVNPATYIPLEGDKATIIYDWR